MGALAETIAGHKGGLKGIIGAERNARKIIKNGAPVDAATDPRSRLRGARIRSLQELSGAGDEFVILVARREADGSVSLIGSVEGDKGLTEKALSKTVF
jgi:hypothetical protein